MKECKYCHSMYDDNLTVCPNCGGNKIVTAEDRAEEAGLRKKEIENREKAMEVPARQRKTVISIIAAVVVVVVTIVFIFSFNANKPLSNGMTQDQGDTILAEGVAYYEDGNFEQAIECLTQLPSDSKQHEKAQSIIEKSMQEYKAAIIEKATNYVDVGNYDAAISLIKNAETFLPNDSDLGKLYQDTYRTSVLASAESYIENGDLSVAMSVLESGLKALPNDVVLQDKYAAVFAEYKALVCQNAISAANEYVAANDYPSAIAALNDAIEELGNDAELEAKQAAVISEYKNIIIEKSQNALADTGYIDAMAVINEGLSVLDNDSEFLSMLDEYKSYAPLYLSYDDAYSMNEFLQTDISDNTWLTDNYGTTYTSDRVICNKSSGLFSGEGTIQYYLASQYKTLTGTVYVPDVSKSLNTNSLLVTLPYVQVWGDDALLYELNSLVNTDKPVNFNIDISNVEFLVIKIYGGWFRGNGTGLIPINCVADLAVAKQ